MRSGVHNLGIVQPWETANDRSRLIPSMLPAPRWDSGQSGLLTDNGDRCIKLTALTYLTHALRFRRIHAVVPIRVTTRKISFHDPLLPAIVTKSIRRFEAVQRHLRSTCLVLSAPAVRQTDNAAEWTGQKRPGAIPMWMQGSCSPTAASPLVRWDIPFQTTDGRGCRKATMRRETTGTFRRFNMF
jgi:hypothetical protein